jgi:hypothetical protein
MPMKLKVHILLPVLLNCLQLSAQTRDKKLIQFTGIIITSDSASAVPFATVNIKGTGKGSLTDFVGFFSIPVRKRDTVEISAIGYKKTRVIIPDSIGKGQFYSIIALTQDTVLLKAVVIRPWPAIEQFKHIFLQKKIPDDDLERAKKNLSKENMQMAYDNMPMNSSMNFRNATYQHAEKLYYAGQYPPNRLLDPLAWVKFIKALQDGDLKIKKEQ